MPCEEVALVESGKVLLAELIELTVPWIDNV
jgi:hypothetical protein